MSRVGIRDRFSCLTFSVLLVSLSAFLCCLRHHMIMTATKYIPVERPARLGKWWSVVQCSVPRPPVPGPFALWQWAPNPTWMPYPVGHESRPTLDRLLPLSLPLVILWSSRLCVKRPGKSQTRVGRVPTIFPMPKPCARAIAWLLHTSDAADDVTRRDRVGCRRLTKSTR